jgi:hypothetical protein
MPKRISKRTTDSNQVAFQVLQAVTEEPVGARKIDPAIDPALVSKLMAAMGRKGGKIGGKRSMETMTPAERKKRAKKAAQSRWKKPPK